MKNLTTAGRGLCHDQALCKFSMVDMKFVDVLHLRILAWLWNWGSGSTEQLLFCPSKLRKKFNLIWLIESLQEDFWIIFSLIFSQVSLPTAYSFAKLILTLESRDHWVEIHRRPLVTEATEVTPEPFCASIKNWYFMYFVCSVHCSSICMHYTKACVLLWTFLRSIPEYSCTWAWGDL